MPYSYDFIGYGIRGYRSFSDEMALVGPFGKVHLITGQNNSGKSALSNVAIRAFSKIRFGGQLSSQDSVFSDEDYPQTDTRVNRPPFILSLGFSKSALLSNETVVRLRKEERGQLDDFLSLPEISRGDENACWVDFEVPSASERSPFSHELAISREQFGGVKFGSAPSALSQLSMSISGRGDGDFVSNSENIFRKLLPWDSIPSAIKVNAIRKTTSITNQANQGVNSGEGLINELLRLSNPRPQDQYVSGEKWQRFLTFVRDILDDESANVLIDADASMIQVRTGGTDYLALADLGTGIEELVILAAVVACNTNKLIVIEEPEIHLHPSLQGKIISNLQKDGNGNRFLITTHSPTIINSENVTITHVTKSEGVSYSQAIDTAPSIREAIDDIGARPADLLQTNYVVWVEGPSDRIYINHWLSKVAPDLREGIDYSVMIYGGKLLNACSADWEEGDELISLFRINTHFCVLMDSDRSAPRKKVNTTKSRIKKECEKSGCLFWITDGRTIENYIPEDNMRKALDELYPGRRFRHKLNDRFECPLDFTFTGSKAKPDKIKVARHVASQDFMPSGQLLKRVESLAKDIYRTKTS